MYLPPRKADRPLPARSGHSDFAGPDGGLSAGRGPSPEGQGSCRAVRLVASAVTHRTGFGEWPGIKEPLMRPADKSSVQSYLEKFRGREDQCPEADPVPA